MKKIQSILIPITLAFVAVLAFASSAHAQTPVPPTGKITVAGQIVNGTPGGTVPVSLTLMLHAYDGNTTSLMLHSVADSTGKFRFEDLDMAPGRTFEVMASLGHAAYFSPEIEPKVGQAVLDAPITIYDTTTDASHVSIERMDTQLEFIGETWVQVSEAYILSNDGDHTVEGATKADDGTPATLRFSLPAGAKELEFQGGQLGQRFLQTADGFVDVWALPPGKGSSRVTVRYALRFNSKVHLDRKLNYATTRINVMLPGSEVTLTSTLLQPQGFQPLDTGTSAWLFTADALAAGQSFSFDLTGKSKLAQPATVDKTPARGTLAQPGLLLVGLTLGLALIAGGFVWMRFTSSQSQTVQVEADSDTQRSEIIQAMADLDDDFEAGLVTEAERDHQHSLLRAELTALLEQHQLASIEP